MALSEERRAYYIKLVSDYEGFLTREHEPGFYTVIINFPNGSKRTNAEHISWLIMPMKSC